MAQGSSKRSMKVTTRSRALGKPATARTADKTAGKAAAKSTHMRRQARLHGPLGQPKAQSYREWTSFAATNHSDFGYGAYFADAETRR